MLGQQIPAHLVGHPDVAEDEAQDVLVHDAFAHQAHGQDAQALLKGLGHAVHLLRAGRGAAHVHLMRRVADEADQPPVEEDRHDLESVGEVARAEQRVVQQDRVAGAQLVDGEPVGEHGLHDIREGAEMPGAERPLRIHPAARVEDRGREVVALAHAFGERRVAQRDAQLLGDRQRDRRH